MKYNSPFGGGVNDPYIDGNVAGGIKGSRVPGAAIEDTQREITHVIDYFLGDGSFGSAASDADTQQLRKAMEVLFKNNKTFPEIETATNALAITDNADGTITLNPAQSWLWRGAVLISSDDFVLADRTLAHAASKTYHLRWYASGTGTATPAATYPKGRFELVDMTAAAPVENDASYDSTYDRMLIAKIVTDVGNVPTVTALANKASMSGKLTAAARNYSGASEADHNFYFAVNWARTPEIALGALRGPGNARDSDYTIRPITVTRYQIHMYSWSWHLNYPAQSPGFDLQLGS